MSQDATFDTSFWVNAFRAGLLPFVLARFDLHVSPDVAAELPESNPPGREFQRLLGVGALDGSALLRCQSATSARGSGQR